MGPNILTILNNLTDAGLLVCWESRLVPRILRIVEDFPCEAIRLVEFEEDVKDAVSCLLQCMECLSNRMYSVLTSPQPADVIIKLHASIDSEAVPSESLLISCLRISGDTSATLRMDPRQATVVQVAAAVDTATTRVAWDQNVYSLADFVEHYGEDEGLQIWHDSEVRVAADTKKFPVNEYLSAYSHEEFTHGARRGPCPSGEQEWRDSRRLASSVQFVLPNSALLADGRQLVAAAFGLALDQSA